MATDAPISQACRARALTTKGSPRRGKSAFLTAPSLWPDPARSRTAPVTFARLPRLSDFPRRH
eukprot:11160378-Lingulodinium_polyedra.AAC.1